MKNGSNFYERSGDWVLNLGDPTSDAEERTYKNKPASNAAGRNKLKTLIRRFANSLKKQEGRIRKLY